jgi:molybdopterin molybdotransferase
MQSLQDIAAALQGYDPKALAANQVNAFLDALVEPVTQTETVGVMDALGRVLAADLISPISVPAHDNSAMDGYALKGSDAQGPQSTTLEVVGQAFAGEAFGGRVESGQCVHIMTGAVMPEGLDTVVPIEMVQVSGKHVTVPAGCVQTGDNRRLMGEDLMQGQPALRKGDIVGPAAMGLIASLGVAQVTVMRRLKVAYFSTGNEILSLGDAPRTGAVYDSNRYTVFGLLTRMGVQVLDMGVIPDEPVALEAAFQSAAEQADAIITSGGVSIGEADHTKAMMRRLGDVEFWRIAMRPGRPMAVGRMRDGHSRAVLFGLPGNPVAVMVTFLAFVRPTLRRMMGAHVTQPLYLQAQSTETMRKKPGRTEYQRGIVAWSEQGSLTVRTTGNQGSGVLSSMVQANGLIVLHHHQGHVAVGDVVDVMMFDGVI